MRRLKIPVQDLEREGARVQGKGIGALQSGNMARVSYAYLDTENIAGVIFEGLQRK